MAIRKKEKKNPSRPTPPAIGLRRTPNRPRFTSSSLPRRLSNGRLTKRGKDRVRKIQRGTLPKATILAPVSRFPPPPKSEESTILSKLQSSPRTHNQISCKPKKPIHPAKPQIVSAIAAFTNYGSYSNLASLGLFSLQLWLSGLICFTGVSSNQGESEIRMCIVSKERSYSQDCVRQRERGLWQENVAAIVLRPDHGGRNEVTELYNHEGKEKERGVSSKSKRKRAIDESLWPRSNSKESEMGEWSLKSRVYGFPLLQVMGQISLEKDLKASVWGGAGVAIGEFVSCNFIRRSEVGEGEVSGLSGTLSCLEKGVSDLLVFLCKVKEEGEFYHKCVY